MKTDDDKLKEYFKHAFRYHREAVPDFDAMWTSAEKASRKKNQLIWKIAASLALLVTVGVFVTKDMIEDYEESNSSIQIATWEAPTGSLVASEKSEPSNSLLGWTSPTDFLLTTNNENIK